MRVAGFFGGLDGDDLCCAERDALAMRRTLASARGVIRNPDLALLYRGKRLTRRAIDAFLASAVGARLDALVFYISGHGNRYGFALANGDFYSFADLRDWFAYLDLIGTRVIAIFDTCEAGGLVGLVKAGEALEGIEQGALELSWLELIASAGLGVRAYGAVTAARKAYEAPELGHGRFTAALLRALRRNHGTLRGNVGRFVSDVEAFATAHFALLKRYGPDAAPEHVGGTDPIPLVATDIDDVWGSVTINLATRGVELDIGVGVSGRRYLPTRLRASFETRTAHQIQEFNDVILPLDDASRFGRTVRANVLLAAVSVPALYRDPCFWRVWAEDERGRTIGEARGQWVRIARPRLVPRLVIPRSW